MKNLIVRALTGAVYVVLLAGCTLYGPVSAYLFFSIVAMATLWEFSTLMNRHYGAALIPYLNAFAGILLTSAVWLWLVGGNGTGQAFALYGMLMLYMLVSELYRKAADPLKNWALVFASQIYVALPFALLPLMSVGYDENGRIVDMAMNPKYAEGEHDVALNIIIINTKYLQNIVRESIAHGFTSLTRDIMLRNKDERNYRVYHYDGAFATISSLEDSNFLATQGITDTTNIFSGSISCFWA